VILVFTDGGGEPAVATKVEALGELIDGFEVGGGGGGRETRDEAEECGEGDGEEELRVVGELMGVTERERRTYLKLHFEGWDEGCWMCDCTWDRGRFWLCTWEVDRSMRERERERERRDCCCSILRRKWTAAQSRWVERECCCCCWKRRDERRASFIDKRERVNKLW
jgi:hypothetical protein